MLTRLKTQLTQTASAFRELYDSLGRAASPAPEENPAIIFDRAAEKTCRGCALCDLCWQKEYNSTFNAFNDATPYLLERGRAMVMAQSVPSICPPRELTSSASLSVAENRSIRERGTDSTTTRFRS